MHKTFKHIKSLCVVALLFGLMACATGGSMTHHTFSFNTLQDSPSYEVMDYQYGSSKMVGTYPERERVALGQTFSRTNISGQIPRGEFLYVKWRNKNTGMVYEDKVDLRNRLPADISDHKIRFIVKGPQLYIYLISPELRSPSSPPGPVRVYEHKKQTQIYPG